VAGILRIGLSQGPAEGNSFGERGVDLGGQSPGRGGLITNGVGGCNRG
jgi:hypothetical protein